MKIADDDMFYPILGEIRNFSVLETGIYPCWDIKNKCHITLGGGIKTVL